MATSVTINGQRTALPGVYADPRYTGAARALPRAKVVAILGEFPELENGVLGRFTSGSELVAAAPVNQTLEQAAAIAFNPGNDPNVGSPSTILVASTLASSAATGALNDAFDNLGVSLASRLFGPTGNQITYTFSAATDPLKRNLTVYKQGVAEPLTNLGSGSVIDVGYAGTFADAISLGATGPIFDEDLGEVTAEVSVTLTKNLDAAGAYTVPAADKTADGVLSFSAATPAPLTSVAIAVATDVFTKTAHGLEIGDHVRVSDLVGATYPLGVTATLILRVSPTGFSANAFSVAHPIDGDIINFAGVDGTATVTRVDPFGVAPLALVDVPGATDAWEFAGHGLLVGDRVLLSDLNDVSIPGHTADTVYYVIAAGYGDETFSLSTTPGGAAINATVAVAGTATVTYQPVAVTVAGAATSGAALVEVVSFPVGFDGVLNTTASWSRIDSLTMTQTGGGSSILSASWRVAKVDKQSARSLAQVAGILGDLANITAAVKNARAATLTLGDLDVMPSTDFVSTAAKLRADASEFCRQVSTQSTFVTAERALPVAAWALTQVDTTGTGSARAGSTAMTMTSVGSLVAGDIIFIGPTASNPLAYAVVASVDSGTTLTLQSASPFTFSELPVFRLSNASAGRPAAFSGSRTLAGGLVGTTTADSLLAARSALAFSETSIIAVMSFDPVIIRSAYDHAVKMAGVGANECFVWAAFPAGSTFDELDEGTLAYNSRHIGWAAQSIRVVDPRGNRRVLDPRFQALQLAAMMGGVAIAEPITSKYARVLGVVEGPDWDGTDNPTALIDIGVTVYRRDTLGYHVARAVTSYRASDDVNQSEVSANESAFWQVRDMRAELKSIIGRNSSAVLPEALAGNVLARARVQVTGKLIRAIHEDTVQISQVGDTAVVSYDYEPSVPYNFVLLQPNVRQVQFQFNTN